MQHPCDNEKKTNADETVKKFRIYEKTNLVYVDINESELSFGVGKPSWNPKIKKSYLYIVLKGPPKTGLVDEDNINVVEIDTDQVGTTPDHAEKYVVDQIVYLPLKKEERYIVSAGTGIQQMTVLSSWQRVYPNTSSSETGKNSTVIGIALYEPRGCKLRKGWVVEDK